MANNSKKKTYGAIERDKQNLNISGSKKIKEANAMFGTKNVKELINTQELIKNNIEAHSIAKINIDCIIPRERNEFDVISVETLKVSIKSVGLLNPIIVRIGTQNKYVIISGHRRFAAIKEIYQEYSELITNEQSLQKIDELKKNQALYTMIPAIVFELADDNPELLGTDPKYITKEIEEEMYLAANFENRQIEKNAIAKHVSYFYNQIKKNPKYEQELLRKRNETAQRKATKLNMPETISDIITQDLKFPVASSYVWQVVKLLESEAEYPKYYEIAQKDIDRGIPVKKVFKNYQMAVKIHKHKFETKDVEKEYATRIEKGTEDIKDIYNEVFNIKPKEEQKREFTKRIAEEILLKVKAGKLTINEAILQIRKY